MKVSYNPFPVRVYYGKSTFCDRFMELERLTENAKNQINTTLFSIRRMGKTGLIYRFFDDIKEKNEAKCVYVDVFSTQSQLEFTNILATSILKVFPQSKFIGRKFIDFIKGFSPVISYDPLSGVPQIEFSFTNPQQQEITLRSLLYFLDQQKKTIIVAIDEFQQIAHYPEKNTESLLRTLIQELKNVMFIFSGSHQHLLTEIFHQAKRPFFSSTQPLYLKAIDSSIYANFIQNIFTSYKKYISEEAVNFILEWTKTHTYYTQALCNRVFAQTRTKVSINEVYAACNHILNEQEAIFFQYRSLLTPAQWNLLQAVARENKVYQPTGSEFIQTHQLGNASTVKRSLDSLLKKEMLYQENDKKKGKSYSVYDCFLSRWLVR